MPSGTHLGRCLSLAVAFAVISTTTHAQSNRIMGHVRYEQIKGQPQMGYRGLYETNLFLTPADDSVAIGRSRRLGTWGYNGSSCYNGLFHDGSYCIDNMDRVNGTPNQPIPNGTYSVFVNEPLFYVVPTVITNVTLKGTGNVTLNPELPIDFSTYHFDDWVGKTEDGDNRPPSSPWYQTFVATGIGIRGATFCYAGEDPDYFDLAILEDNGYPNVVNWKVIGEKRVQNPGGGLKDNWVRWRSFEIRTTPGQEYALRITGYGGVNNGGFQPFIRDKDGGSYAHGEAHDRTGTPQGHDLNATIFTDGDGTITTVSERTGRMGELKSPSYWGTKWGQSFIAQGSGLAAADFKAASGSQSAWAVNVRWKVFEGADDNGPTGSQVGVTKITSPAWNPFAFHQAVSYNPGEMPLTSGQTYFVQFEVYDPPPEITGFNPYLMDADSYDGGHGYWWNGSAWDPRPEDDVNMTIVEYAIGRPGISLDRDTISRTVYLGDPLSADTLTVTNAGKDTLLYAITDDVDWLGADPKSGSATDETDTIGVIYSLGNLACGQHRATIEITGNARNAPQRVDVTVTVYTVGPDLDCDTDVDQDDFRLFQDCYASPGASVMGAPCDQASFDGDDDVDQDDFTIFQDCMAGPDVPAARTCDNP